MHLALQTLLQHGRFVQLRYWLLARHSALPAPVQHHVLGLQAAHLFVSTLTAALLPCSCCCVSESCAVVEARCASASFLA
jgi:hypothetical protein